MKRFLPELIIKHAIVLIMVVFFVDVATAQTPLIKLSFDEESAPPANTGSLSATFVKSATIPAATGNVAPPYSAQGLNSFDFGTTPGNYYVESSDVINGLRNLTAFTLTGWLNVASAVAGNGGNRIISWINNGGDGVDLVFQSNGSLRLGVDGWPDNSPAVSSAGKFPVSPLGSSDAWVFFAVTYQSSGQVQFYFGNGSSSAALDVTRTYSGPGVTGSNISRLAVGAFNSATRNSATYDRMFRGIIDDVRIYGSVLNATDIVTVQGLAPLDSTPPTAPTNLTFTAKTSTTIDLSWTASTDNVEVTGYNVYNGTTLMGSVGAFTTITLTGLTPNTQYNLTLKARDAALNVSPASNAIIVTTDPGALPSPLVNLLFKESSGLSITNIGSTGATFSSSANTPSASAIIPNGGGQPSSADFGTTPGNYYIESAAPIDALKNLNAFTLTGWLNNKSSTAGPGGNRIISWINNGGDGVDLVYQSDGSLRLGVDGWPDNSPAVSSSAKVPTNSLAPQENWVFFAVTYQSTGQVQFYFGNHALDASIDVTRTYAGRGVTGSNIGKLAIGAFNSASRSAATYDRMLRGLVNGIQIYSSVLSPADIVTIQRGVLSDTTPPTAPGDLVITQQGSTGVDLSWTASSDNVGVVQYLVYNNGTLLQSGDTQTSIHVFGLTSNMSYNLTVVARDAANNLSAESNTVSFTTDIEPLISVSFNEGSAFQFNHGSLGGQFEPTSHSTNVPDGVGAPYSSDGGTASFGKINGLENRSSFTITGWLNSRSAAPGPGGSPLFNSISETLEGIDLIAQSDGSIQLGVDEWAYNTVAKSSPNKITSNASTPASNWIFFAATYQSDGHVEFYFGNNTQDAAPDVTRSYTGRGATGATTNVLGIGLYESPVTGPYPDARFAGLMDDFKVYGYVLTPQQIISVQRGPADAIPPTAPAGLNVTSKSNVSVSLNWTDGGTDNIGITSYEIYNGSVLLTTHIPDVKVMGSLNNKTVTGLTPGTTYTLTLKAKDAHGNLSPPSNAVVVTTDGATVGTPIIYLTLNETAGSVSSNSGSASVTFNRPGGTPAQSASVPASVGGSASADFGTTPMNAYVQSTTVVDALKNLTSFTLTGWLNNKSNVAGNGGNRVISWINNGGDGVDLVYQNDGSLRLGVDGWPDNSPAVSSSNKVTTNAAAIPSNWVFFAVTYQSNGQVQFFFGNNSADATLDVTKTYSGPGVTGANIGKIAIGAFNDASRGPSSYDRMFRGLIDEIYVYGSVLTPQQIVAVQRGTGNGSSGRMNIAETPEPRIAEETPELQTVMYQNYPNPFVETTNIEMYLQPSVRVARVVVYDLTGRAIKNIDVEGRGPTSVTVMGDNMTTGVYVYSLVADGKVVDIKRMAVRK